MSKFLNALTVTEIDDSTFMVADHTFDYQSDLAGCVFSVPAGFRTDFASVPRIGWIFAFLGGIAHEPAVIHDWLYWANITTKELADKVLLEAMEVIGIPATKRYPIYWGVKFGGFQAWDGHRKANHSAKNFGV